MFYLQYIIPVKICQSDQILIYCFMVGNSWDDRGLLDERLWFGNAGLAHLSMLHKCCQPFVFWLSVLLYTYPTVQLSTTQRKPDLIFISATSPIFRGPSHEKMWHPAHDPCFARAVGKMSLSWLFYLYRNSGYFCHDYVTLRQRKYHNSMFPVSALEIWCYIDM